MAFNTAERHDRNTNKQPIVLTSFKRHDDNYAINRKDKGIKNNKPGQYEFSIHRKEAITNVHIK